MALYVCGTGFASLPMHTYLWFLICTVQEALMGYCPVKSGSTTSQLDPPSLTPLPVAGWDLFQPGVAVAGCIDHIFFYLEAAGST